MKNENINQSQEFFVFEHLKQQFKVNTKMKIKIPFDPNLKIDQKIIFDKVIMTDKAVGMPYLEEYQVIAKCLKTDFKDDKIIVFKYKSKKNYRVKTGHRQKWILIQIMELKTPQKITTQKK